MKSFNAPRTLLRATGIHVALFCIVTVLGFFGWICVASRARAEERELTVYNGDRAVGDEDDDITYIQHFFVGDTGQIKPYESGTGRWDTPEEEVWTYTSSDSAIVSVDNEGHYKVVSGGYAYVTVEGKETDGNVVFTGQYEFYCCADLSLASLSKASVQMYQINYPVSETKVDFQNLPDFKYYIFSYTSSDPSVDVSCEFGAETKTLTVRSWGEGSTTLTIVLNNKTFVLKVKTNVVTINKTSVVLAKSKTVKLRLKGYSGKVTWKSTAKKKVRVNSKGVVRAAKTGNAVVYAVIDGNRIGCAVSSVTAKRKKVINAAKKIATGTYSQEKRMSKGYYDCSSLVWRAYQKEGKTFGSKNYAPVAADLCKWCFQHKKRVQGGLSTKNIQKMKLRPGDLLFETGLDNGRYKGVYHVEMFVGYDCVGFDDKGNPVLSTLWAARTANYYTGGIMGHP